MAATMISEMGVNTLLKLIQDTRLVIDDANRRLATLEAEYNNRLNQALPISRIPANVLASIFRIAQVQSRDGRLPLEIRVSRVSSRWRRVVTETPALWSNITLKAIQSGNNIVTWWKGPQVLDLYTSRFQNCPLKITFAFINTGYKRYLRVLAPFVAQWQHLDLVSNVADSDEKVWKILCRNGAPLLECLCLDPRRSPDATRHVPNAADYPSLKTLKINRTPYESWTPYFSSLTTLSLGHCTEVITYSGLDHMLISLPHLINLSLNFLKVTLPLEYLPFNPPSITHSALKWLKIGDFSTFHWMTARLTLPNLHTVELCDLETSSHKRQTSRPFPSVESLIIRNLKRPENDDNLDAEEDYFYDASLILIFPNISTLTLDVIPRFPNLDLISTDEDEEDFYSDDCYDCSRFACDRCPDRVGERAERREAREEARKTAETELPVLDFSLAVPYSTSNCLPWPELCTLALGRIGCLNSHPRADPLIKDLRRRKKKKLPIHKFVVPPGTRATYSEHWCVLSEVAEVEETYASTGDMWNTA